MKKFSINLNGRVKNFNLPKNKPLLPLLEAIVNSIHAIEERKNDGEFSGQGLIKIVAVRRNDNLFENGDKELSGFVIEDNGIGFNDRNFNSFMESDSTYKATKGGKGVGRFSWLKAFDNVLINSIYREDTKTVERKFCFSLLNNEIDDEICDFMDAQDNKTSISLLDYKKEYRSCLPKNGRTIALKIMQHCLVYFLSEDCPKICYIDDEQTYDINKIFNETIIDNKSKEIFEINGRQFNLSNIKMGEASSEGNKLYLCANNRVVDEKELEKFIIDLDGQFFSHHQFYYVGVLTSDYLDNNVDMNRLSFNIPKKGQDLFNDISLEQITGECYKKIETYLKDYLLPIKEEKNKRILKYVTDDAPEYRHLLKYMPEEISKIKPNTSTENLDDELYKIKREFDKKVKGENQILLDRIQKDFESEYDYKTLFKDQIMKINDANKAELANYVARRKIIINLLEKGIKRNESSKFNKESYIHNLIYPMRTTSDEIEYDSHNLWLLDEKLAYCNFISSDVPFNNDNRETRTDLMILDNPVAVSDEENDGGDFDTIVLFELKKPMRDDYSAAENPVLQLYNYVDKIKSGKAKDKYGRLINVGKGTKFYLYAVCDITKSLEIIIRHNSFKNTPDKMGYYTYNENYNAYVEILSFDKIIKDSKKRNRVLFEKLGI